MSDKKNGNVPEMELLAERMNESPEELEPILREREDADKKPQVSNWNYTFKYIVADMICKALHIHTSWNKIEDLYQDLQSACIEWSGGDCELELAFLRRLAEIWPKAKQMLRNPSHFMFISEYGVNSQPILAYVWVLSKLSPAMEFAWGYSFDLLDRYTKVTQEDEAAYHMVMRESTARSFTQRDWFLQEVVIDYLKHVAYKPTVVSLAAGMMPEWRHFGWKLDMLRGIFGKVVAYDRDAQIPRYLLEVLGCPIEDYGVEYHIDDVDAAFRNRKLLGKTDIVYMKGFMSYHKKKAETLHYLSSVAKLLKPGGIMVFDVQVFEAMMLRCATSLGWGGTSLFPDWTVKSAVKRISRHAKEVGLQVDSYKVDSFNDNPTFVQFCLRKPL